MRKYFRAKHGQANLRAALKSKFHDKLLGEAKHRVIIPTVNYSKGKPHLLKTPHHESFKLDWSWKAVDVALATSAAPVYLPMAKVENRGVFVDGGLYANAPGLLGVHEARTFLGMHEAQIALLAIGTMSAELTLPGEAKLNPGVLGWSTNLFELLISSQEMLTHYILGHQLRERYFQIDKTPTEHQAKDLALDLASPAAIETLSFRAHDTFQAAIGSREFERFTRHTATPPVFFHGPNASRSPA